MGDFSQSPDDLLAASQAKGYIGLHIAQGVPVLDRDLNLLQDLLAAGIRSALAAFFGDGAAAGSDAFLITATTPPAADLVITGPGSLLVSGLQVPIAGSLAYTAQVPPAPITLPPLSTPTSPAPNPRVDTAYLDAWLTEVDDTVDPVLGNSLDIGMLTSVRQKLTWLVRVAEGSPVPPADPGHVVYPLAQLRRPLGQAAITTDMITDLRQGNLTVSRLEQRLALMERVLLLPSFVPQGSLIPQFTPQSGAVGQAVQLNGANFNVGSISVLFGGIEAQLVGMPSATQAVARVPGGLTPNGTAAAVTLTVHNQGGDAISDDVFVVRPFPAFGDPGHQFSPTHGVPGTTVTLNGFNLNVGTPSVTFNPTPPAPPVPATLVGPPTSTSAVVQVPAGLVPSAASFADVKIAITTTAGTDISDDSFRAEVTTPAPVFAASPQFLPQTGAAGQIVTLSGSNFNFAPVSVRFGSTPATITAAPSATQIVVQRPPGLPTGPAGAAPITVTTAGGSVTSTDLFVAS